MPSEKKKPHKRKAIVTQEETPQTDTPLLNPRQVMLQFMQDFLGFISQQQQHQQQPLSTPDMDSSSFSSIKGLVDFLKIGLEPFVGTTNQVEAENWVDEMEKVF